MNLTVNIIIKGEKLDLWNKDDQNLGKFNSLRNTLTNSQSVKYEPFCVLVDLR